MGVGGGRGQRAEPEERQEMSVWSEMRNGAREIDAKP